MKHFVFTFGGKIAKIVLTEKEIQHAKKFNYNPYPSSIQKKVFQSKIWDVKELESISALTDQQFDNCVTEGCVTIGEELVLYFNGNEKGGKPVARVEDGRVAIVTFNNREFIEVGSSWVCKVLELHKNKVIVNPLKLDADSTINRQLVRDGIDELVAKFKSK